MKRAVLAMALLAAPATSAREVTFESALADFFAAAEISDREKAMRPLLRADPEFSVIFARLRTGRVYPTDVETGRLDWSRKGSGGRRRRHQYVVLVPEDYDPTKRYRVCFYLHGGVSRPDPWRKGGEWWRRFDRFDGMDQISVFPASWRDSLWWESSQIENVAAILDRIKTTYNVDEDRVFLYGVSDGGTGVYYHAMKAPTIWAAFFPFIGHPSVLANSATGVEGEMFESNLAGKALYIVNGETDRLYPAARVLPYVEAFRQEGATIVFRARPGGHNTRWWNRESPRMEAFMNEHPRDPLPDRLVWATEDVRHFGRVHWLLVDALADGRPAGGLFTHHAPFGQVVVEREGNVFHVTAQGVERYRLLLSPDVVDFAEPVKVVTNGAVSFEGLVATSVETLLTWAARDNDRTLLFGAELTITIDDEQGR